MDWITHNWVWVIFVISVLLMMRRGGMSCGMGHDRSGADSGQNSQKENGHIAEHLDPVNGISVDPENCLSSVYQGRIYYFSSKENREQFESTPSKYEHGGESFRTEPRPHHHGC